MSMVVIAPELRRADSRATLAKMRRQAKTLATPLLRPLAQTLIACIACAVCASAQINVRLQTREAIEAHLKSFSTKNSEREALIRKWFADSGCKDPNLSEQALDRKLPPNVICVLPGETQEVIVVGAHTDHVDSFGDGVVDNWTGAVLLPSLLYSLSAQPSSHADLRRILGRGKGAGWIAVLRRSPHQRTARTHRGHGELRQPGARSNRGLGFARRQSDA